MMDDYVSESDSDYTSYWRDWFISSRGNEYFCEIDEDYLTDRFNLTGLNTEVQYYQYALDLVTDVFDLDCDDEMRETIEKSARHLYGLVHARYIVTTRGLAKMLDKYKKGEFGKCPRVQCGSHPLLPMGLSDIPNLKPVKLYCGRCEDIYNPKSSRHAAIDGAYFGTSFHNILFQVYPALIPQKSVERYIPRVYGFKVHAPAALVRWQNAKRDDMRRRLRKLDIETGFRDEIGDEEDEDEDEVEFEGIDGPHGGGSMKNGNVAQDETLKKLGYNRNTRFGEDTTLVWGGDTITATPRRSSVILWPVKVVLLVFIQLYGLAFLGRRWGKRGHRLG